MDNADNDLLISAYLDGELNADERAYVEQLLASSAEARQLVDELRALRVSLQELPQHTLELEFAQRVLNRAERELNAERIALVAAEGDLTEESSVAKVPVIAPTAVDRALSDGVRKTSETAESSEFARHVRRALTNRRGLGWSFVAIAAALVIMVSNRQQPAINQPAAGPEARDKLVMSPAPTMRGLSTNESRSQPAPAQPPLSDFVADAPTASQSGQLGRGNVAELDAASVMNRAEQQPAPGAGGVKGVFDEPSQRLDDRIATNSRASAVNPTGQTEELATSGKLVAEKESSPIADREEIVVIQVSMSPEAARRGVFKQMLAKNHIVLGDAATNHATLLRQIEDRVPELREQLEQPPGKETAGEQLRDRTEIETTPQGGLAVDKDQRDKYLFKAAGPEPSGVELVYVEAAADQINGTLADLRDTPLEFSVISAAAPQADVALQLANPARARNSIEPLAQENRAEGVRRGGRAGGGGGGMGGGGRGGFGGGGFGGSSPGNGTFGRGLATNQFGAQEPPATNLGADANAKTAELKKADESVDRKATEAEKAKVAGDVSSNSGVDQFGVQRKPQELPALNQPTSATGHAERLSLLELRRRLARGTEPANPTDDLAAQGNPRPKAETSDEKSVRRFNSADANYLRQKQAGGAPAAQPASPPAGANAPVSASAAATTENKGAMSGAAKDNATDLPRQEFSLDGLNGDLSKNNLGAISTGAAGAIEKDRRPADGAVGASNGRRRALFVLRVVEPPMAAKPAPAASAPAPAGSRP